MKRIVVEGVIASDIADKGKALGKAEEKVIFIEGAVPGDIVDVLITKRSRSFDEGRIEKLVSPSPNRTDPFCEHFGICGGCKWQHMTYESQLFFKEKQVRDAMERLAKIPDAPVEPIHGSPSIRFYRNKMEFTFTDRRYLLESEINIPGEKDMDGLGFHIPGKFNKVLDLHHCYLQDQRADEIRLFVRNLSKEKGFAYSNLKHHTGFMRNLLIRNTSTGEWMVIVVFGEDHPEQIQNLMEAIRDQFSWITSLQYIINKKKNDSLHDQEAILFNGNPHIVEQLENLKFLIGPKSFFQTNSVQALELYRIAREFAGLQGNEIVYDLYTGTGSIAAFVAAKAKKVIGVEYINDAIEDAKKNAALNGITNTEFVVGDMKDVFTPEFIGTHGKPDVIITDPPRAGMHGDVVQCILDSGAEKVVYVSCNPATQARDIALLLPGYELIKVVPVDMFPHTSHVESVALLVKK